MNYKAEPEINDNDPVEVPYKRDWTFVVSLALAVTGVVLATLGVLAR